MTRWIAALAVAGVALVAHAQPIEIEGQKFETSALVGGQTLQLNGVGVRTRVIFKVYVAGLYVPQKSTSAATLLAQTGPRRVEIHMLRDVSADTFAEALIEGLKANHTEQQVAAMKPQIDALLANLKSAGEARKGSVILFDFVPAEGTRLLVDGQPKGSAIAGEGFFTAVLRIWIGDKPADAALKKGLLGA